MTLRVRLIILVATIVSCTFASSYLIIAEHKHNLMESLDDSLYRASEQAAGVAQPITESENSDAILVPSVTSTNPGDGTVYETQSAGKSILPLSDVVISIVSSNGEVWSVTQGTSKTSIPNLLEINFRDVSVPQFMVASGINANETFRLLVYPLENQFWLVSSRSLTEIDSKVHDLTITVAWGVTSVAVMLIILLLWVFRLGLRPLELVTDAANSIIAGSRREYVPRSARGTEADRLSQAFNLMVDQRNKADDALRQFVADASHELRTPITSFEGLLELVARNESSDSDYKDIISRLRNESRRMKELVENLLLLANLDEGQKLQEEVVDLARISRNAVSDFSIIHPDRDLSFAIESVDHLRLQISAPTFEVKGDDLQIHQVISNLIRNALIHTHSSATIVVTVGRTTDEVFVTVADSGTGIDEEMSEAIFQRFVRGDQSRSRKESSGGFGLGLPIARSIVKALGGELTLESKIGEGSAFTVRLPAINTPSQEFERV